MRNNAQQHGPLELPDFRLEVYLGKYEFTLKHHLTASDFETLTIAEVLALGSDVDREAFMSMRLGYTTTWGDETLRRAIASTYDTLDAENILVFAGAEEAMFWAMQKFLSPGDHAIVTVPNYQSMETVPIATGAEVCGLPIWQGSGSSLEWVFDIDRFQQMLRPNTKLVALNVPNNPTGYLPTADVWAEIVRICDERSILLFSDEVYRGVEIDPSKRIAQAADLSDTAMSLNVMSKAYGLPGLRIGWIACKDRAALERLERAKHYTTICNAGPSELLATITLNNAEAVRERNRHILLENLPHVQALMVRCQDFVEFAAPDGGCVVFPRFLGGEGVEAFAQSLADERSAVVLPSSIYESSLADVPKDRFRIGIGRRNQLDGWAEFEAHIATRR